MSGRSDVGARRPRIRYRGGLLLFAADLLAFAAIVGVWIAVIALFGDRP